MSRYKILVSGEFDRRFFDELVRYGEVVKSTSVKDTQLENVNILVVRSKTKVDKKLVDRMPNLGCVITATHGTDHVDMDYLGEREVEFHMVPVQSYDVSQGVMAYILAYATNLVEGDRSTKKGEWKKNSLMGQRIKGKTLGIVGYGRIGREVAKMASALEMSVIVYDPYAKDIKHKAETLDELLEISDFFTIHIPLNERTKGLIGEEEIEKMKDGVYLINTARGGVIEEPALLEALRKGKISGAALDVYEHQPPHNDKTSWELVKEKNVIATPHSIGQTIEAVEEKGEGVIKIIKEYIKKNNRT